MTNLDIIQLRNIAISQRAFCRALHMETKPWSDPTWWMRQRIWWGERLTIYQSIARLG